MLMLNIWKQEKVYKKNEKYVVKDSLGNFLREFDTYKGVYSFLVTCQRYDWTITEI